MTTTISEFIPIDALAGVCPVTDCTEANTPHYVMADKIRFVKGKPQKLGGWDAVTLNGQDIAGCVRSVFSAQLNSKIQTLLGSNEALYGLIGSENQNITPFNTVAIAIADSLDTDRTTLGSNPLSMTNTSQNVVVADTNASQYAVGDNYTLSGATATGGVPTGDLNKEHVIRAIGTNTVTIRVTTAATSTTTGGGASVVRSTGLITVNDTAHGQANGDRVKLQDAATTGGVLDTSINGEHIIRNITTDTFGVMTDGTATSSVTGGGGSSTEYFDQLTEGLCDETSGQGYGMARYGNGLYGTALVSENNRRLPRIWFFDNFGENVIMTPGNGERVYGWTGTQAAAPTVIANAPTEVNYAFVSDSILVTLGAGGVKNKIKTSDQNALTTWTASSTNQVFEDDIEGAGRFKSHVSLNGTNLLFTDNQCYTFRYIGLPFIWEVKFKDNIGLIAPMARVVVKGIAYWQGQDNFYMWRGGNIEVIPSNSSNESTLLKYVFENVNRSQSSKFFAWYNKRYDEIWFHYATADSLEVNAIARYHVTDRHWVPDTMNRTAAEYPVTSLQLPRLVDSLGNLYRHEVGHDDSQVSMAFSLTTNLQEIQTSNVQQVQLIPDSIQTADTDLAVTVRAKSYPQSPSFKNSKDFTVTPTTEFLPVGVDGRLLQYVISGNALGQEWIMGAWQQGLQLSSREE